MEMRDQKKRDQLAQKMKDKLTKVKKQVGKPTTYRSEKPKLKKKEVKVEIHEDTKDQLTYLGLDLK